MRPTVSLIMIVRNEEKNMASCLEGVAGLMDEIIVVDTGSTDSTRAEAARLGAKVFEFPWIDDFAAARNESLRHATGDWVMWLDADDRIDAVNRERLKAVIDRLGEVDPSGNPVCFMGTLFLMAGHAADVRVDHGRLFPRNGRLGWQGMVHETLGDYSGAPRPIQPIRTDVLIRHEGYQDPQQYARKLQRDLRLLEKGYVLKPDSPFVSFYLGRLHDQLRNRELALQFLRRAIDLDPEGVFTCTTQSYVIAMACLRHLGRLDEAIALGAEGLRRFPTNIEILFNQAQGLYLAGRYVDAERHLRRLLTVPGNELNYAPILESVKTDYPWLLLGESLMRQGRWQEAADCYRKAAEIRPASLDAWFNLSQMGIVMRNRALIEEALGQLDRLPNSMVKTSLLRSQVCILEQNWDGALGWIERVLTLDPRNRDAHLLVSDVLYQQGTDLPRCIAAHRRALELAPGYPEIRRRLAELEARQGDLGAAPVTGGIGGSLAAAASGGGNVAFVA